MTEEFKKYIKDFINSIDDTKKYDKPVTMEDMYEITYEEIVEAREKHGWNITDMPLVELEILSEGENK